MDYLSFKLSAAFVDRYRDREVPWGFVDAAGSPVSEIIFYRTYSRKRSDGSKETWVDVCERVINGMYSLQKDYVKANRLPWSDLKAQRSAEEAFDRLFNLKWTPPGRGLWMMGTELTNKHKNSAALQNPLHEDTRVFTRDGWRRLGDLEGQDVELLSSTFLYGRDNDSTNNVSKWVKGSVSLIEEQPSIEIVYNDTMGNEHSIIASRNHRWFTRRGPHNNWKRVSGDELRPGDLLPVVKPSINFLPSHAGMQHGFFFGDGSRTNGEFQQFGSSTAVMARLFGDQVQYANRYSRVGQCPLAWGFLPEGRYREDKRYVYGFLSGYFAADGSVSKDGQCTVSSARRDELEAVRDLFMDLGIQASPVRLSSTSSNHSADRELWKITLDRFDLQEEFFLKLDHKERWLASTFGKNRHRSHARIKEIRDAGTQRVLCATVPHYEQFVTENFVLTSNCAFISTADIHKNDPGAVFGWLMEASMLGVGVGFDTKGSGKDIAIREPRLKGGAYVVPDSREGWVESTRLLINAYLSNGELPVFDYSLIRPAGAPIKTFGGTAAGPEPLIKLHDKLRTLFESKIGQKLDSLTIMDIANLIGVCVVSGNVRRSAELAMGSLDDEDFLAAKDYEKHPERSEWGWMSNNSVEAKVGDDLSHIVEGIALNGEPGVIWMDVTRKYGRLIDPPNNKDWRAAGFNPCAEQPLESGELCTLSEVFLNRHEDKDDFLRTLKFAFLYAKTVTLLPTHWDKTNAIMQRNRRIGVGTSGHANFVDNHGMPMLREWLDSGYTTVRDWDREYSEWLGVRESIKVTTVKPSGTVSLLAGESPGVHWAPGGEYHLRGVVFQKDDPMVELFRQAGYEIQESAYTPETSVFVQFPIHSNAKRSEKDVTIFEKADLAVNAQRYWSDNSVSVTVSFDAKEEARFVPTVLQMHEGSLKTVSFLPQGNNVYEQMPYVSIDQSEYEEMRDNLLKVDLSSLYRSSESLDAEGEKFCSTDKCMVPGT